MTEMTFETMTVLLSTGDLNHFARALMRQRCPDPMTIGIEKADGDVMARIELSYEEMNRLVDWWNEYGSRDSITLQELPIKTKT